MGSGSSTPQKCPECEECEECVNCEDTNKCSDERFTDLRNKFTKQYTSLQKTTAEKIANQESLINSLNTQLRGKQTPVINPNENPTRQYRFVNGKIVYDGGSRRTRRKVRKSGKPKKSRKNRSCK